MLPRSRKLRSGEVRAVMAKGKTTRGSFLSLKKIPLPSGKVAVVISRKVVPSAVKRNAVRRSIFEVLRTQTLGDHGLIFFVDRLPHTTTKKSFVKAITEDIHKLIQKSI